MGLVLVGPIAVESQLSTQSIFHSARLAELRLAYRKAPFDLFQLVDNLQLAQVRVCGHLFLGLRSNMAANSARAAQAPLILR